MSNKSILFICPNLGSGGSEKMLVKIANHCCQMGMKCEFLLLDSRNQHYQLDNKVLVHHLNLRSMKFSFLPIIKKVRSIKPDIVFSTVTIMNVVVVISSFFFPKVKLIARESSIISINNRYSNIGFFIDWAIKVLYRRFGLIVAQSNAMKEDLVRNYAIPEFKIVQIYNPVDIIPGAAPRINQKNKKVTLLTVGNLRREKGYDRLLKVLAKLDLDFQYFIVGEGAEEQKLKSLCSELTLDEKVVFVGKVSEPAHYYSMADFYLIGSYYEGFPNALLEAGLFGLPSVAFDVPGGIKEIITHESGIVVPDNDFEKYRKAIFELTQTEWNREEIALGIKNRFDHHLLMGKYYNLLLNV